MKYVLPILITLFLFVAVYAWQLEQHDHTELYTVENNDVTDSLKSRASQEGQASKVDSHNHSIEEVVHDHDLLNQLGNTTPPLSTSEIEKAYSLGNLVKQANESELSDLIDDRGSYDQAWLTDISLDKLKSVKQGDVISLQVIDGNVHHVRVSRVDNDEWLQESTDENGTINTKPRGKDTFIMGGVVEAESGLSLKIAMAEDTKMGSHSVLGKFYSPAAPYLLKSSKANPEKIYMLSYSKRVLEKDRWQPFE